MPELYALTARTATGLRQLLADGGGIGGRANTGAAARGVTWVRVTTEAAADGWYTGRVNLTAGAGWDEGNTDVKVAAADGDGLAVGFRYLCTRTGDDADGTARFVTTGAALTANCRALLASLTPTDCVVFDVRPGKGRCANVAAKRIRGYSPDGEFQWVSAGTFYTASGPTSATLYFAGSDNTPVIRLDAGGSGSTSGPVSALMHLVGCVGDWLEFAASSAEWCNLDGQACADNTFRIRVKCGGCSPYDWCGTDAAPTVCATFKTGALGTDCAEIKITATPSLLGFYPYGGDVLREYCAYLFQFFEVDEGELPAGCSDPDRWHSVNEVVAFYDPDYRGGLGGWRVMYRLGFSGFPSQHFFPDPPEDPTPGAPPFALSTFGIGGEITLVEGECDHEPAPGCDGPGDVLEGHPGLTARFPGVINNGVLWIGVLEVWSTTFFIAGVSDVWFYFDGGWKMEVHRGADAGVYSASTSPGCPEVGSHGQTIATFPSIPSFGTTGPIELELP